VVAARRKVWGRSRWAREFNGKFCRRRRPSSLAATPPASNAKITSAARQVPMVSSGRFITLDHPFQPDGKIGPHLGGFVTGRRPEVGRAPGQVSSGQRAGAASCSKSHLFPYRSANTATVP
jgi:hypothetical protein